MALMQFGGRARRKAIGGGIAFMIAAASAAPAAALARDDSQDPAPAAPVAAEETAPSTSLWRRFNGFIAMTNLLVPETTQLLFGVGPQFQPDYFGSDNYEIRADPQVYIRVNNFIFSNETGAEFGVFGVNNLRFGPTLKLVGNRNGNDNAALNGLDPVGRTVEFGGFGAIDIRERYTIKIRYRHALATGHRGGRITGEGSMLLYQRGRISTSLSATTTWMGNDFAEAYFTVSPIEAARTQFPVFQAESGFRDIGGALNGWVRLGDHWALHPYAYYSRILPAAADSPVVAVTGSRDQYIIGLHFMRELRFEKNGGRGEAWRRFPRRLAGLD